MSEQSKTLLGEIRKASNGKIRIIDMRKPQEPAKTPEPKAPTKSR